MNTLVETIEFECESIISEVENVIQSLTDSGLSTFDIDELEIENIRYTAEGLSTLFVYDSSKELIVKESITLYQDCKYILDYIETDCKSIINDEMVKSFGYIRDSVNTIRDMVDEL